MTDDRETRPLRQIDSVQATVDQLEMELRALSAQLLLVIVACGALAFLTGILLWQAVR